VRKPTKLDRLREGIGTGGQSIGELKHIAKSVGFWQERFVARPAAEMLIEQGAPGAETMEATIKTMPITGRDQKADLLRAAFRSALEREGIPPDVERTARSFYEHRRSAVMGDHGLTPDAKPARQTAESSDRPIEPTSTPDIVNVIANAVRRLFGSR
jgi:hypothetical protein